MTGEEIRDQNSEVRIRYVGPSLAKRRPGRNEDLRAMFRIAMQAGDSAVGTHPAINGILPVIPMKMGIQISLFLFIWPLLIFPSGCREHKPVSQNSFFDSSAFNATNAFNEAKTLIEITPRYSGSPGAQKAAEHLLSRLRAMGIETALDEFEEETPAGKMLFRNVVGIMPGKDKDFSPTAHWIIIGAHYDAKSGILDNFEGANDSGSGVGVLLELARIVQTAATNLTSGSFKNGRNFKKVGTDSLVRPSERQKRGGTGCPALPAEKSSWGAAPDVNIMFVFFDGEECKNHYGKNDGLHGSRRLTEQLVKDGRSRKVRAVIILDMVGDRDLNITIPRNSALSLVAALFGAAQAEGTREKFTLSSGEILDDHQPFLSAGMPAIDIIDFEYGSAPGKNDYWHTPEDTADKLSAQSLEIIGRTVLRLLDNLMHGGAERE